MPLHRTTIPDVDRFELAAILAALRLLQAARALPTEIEEIATDQGAFERLDDKAIDALCERINAVCEYPFRDVTAPLQEQSEQHVADAECAGMAYELQMQDRVYFSEGV